jgi:hypothetical protein
MVVLGSLLRNVLFARQTNTPHNGQQAYYNLLKIPQDHLHMLLWIL